MDEPTVLRTARVGGFVKEDVMTYLDELNSKIVSLEEELKVAKEKSGNAPADEHEVTKYKNQIDNLQEKLNQSNNALRAAKKENEELQQQIAALKAGGATPAQGNAQINAQTAAALEAAKKEIESLRNQLRAAEQKANSAAAGNPQAAAALEAAKKEIDNLRNQLKAAEQKAAAPGITVTGAADSAELEKTKQELTKITADLQAKTAELEAKLKEIAEKDSKIAELTKSGEEAAKKDEEIKSLNEQITKLKEEASNPIAQMGAMFAEAQKNVNQIKQNAQDEADKTVSEANAKAEKTVNEANAAADKTIRDANAKAEQILNESNVKIEKAVRDANNAAEKCVNDANKQAKATVDEANSKADKINAMSATVRNMLMNEIESINTKFSDLTNAINKLTGQATDRMTEAKNLIGEARKTVDTSKPEEVKKAEAPKATFEAVKAPSASLADIGAKQPAGEKKDSFGSSSSNSFGGFNNSSNQASKPSAPQQDANKQPQQQKKSANFNFDMAELLKAAEEEASKNPEE